MYTAWYLAESFQSVKFINTLLKEKVFYFFNDDNLLVRTDSTIGNQLVNLYVVVKKETPDAARDIYRINKVYILMLICII